MSDTHPDPRDVIYDFVVKLPSPVRKNVLADILIGVRKSHIGQLHPDLLAELDAYLVQSDTIHAVSSVIIVMALVDFHLSSTVVDYDKKQGRLNNIAAGGSDLEKLAHPALTEIADYRQAAIIWERLKASSLSDSRIRDFQQYILVSPKD